MHFANLRTCKLSVMRAKAWYIKACIFIWSDRGPSSVVSGFSYVSLLLTGRRNIKYILLKHEFLAVVRNRFDRKGDKHLVRLKSDPENIFLLFIYTFTVSLLNRAWRTAQLIVISNANHLLIHFLVYLAYYIVARLLCELYNSAIFLHIGIY
jgi:hypothetical protein